MIKSNIKQMLTNIIYELTMGSPIYLGSLFEFCKFCPKRKKRTQLLAYQQAPKQELKPVVWCKITYRTDNGRSIQRIGADDFIL